MNIVDGNVTYTGIAEAFGLECLNVEDFLHPPPQG